MALHDRATLVRAAHDGRRLVATIDGVAELGPEAPVRGSRLVAAARRLPVRDVRDEAVVGDSVWLGTWGRGVRA